MANNGISPARQTAYYVGHAISGIGILVFLSSFFAPTPTLPSVTTSGMPRFGEMQQMQNQFVQQASSSMSGMTIRAISGMVLIVVGQVIANIGKFGAAGSGVVLDPQQARKDVEPWSRMTGGIISDALDEVQPAKESNLKRAAGLFVDFPSEQLPTPNSPPPTNAERLSEIKTLLDQGLLTPDEYEAKRKAIIDSI